MDTPPSLTVTVEFASAVPVRVGVATELGDGGVTDVIVGAAGATVSIVIAKPADAAETLPPRSVAVAVRT